MQPKPEFKASDQSTQSEHGVLLLMLTVRHFWGSERAKALNIHQIGDTGIAKHLKHHQICDTGVANP